MIEKICLRNIATYEDETLDGLQRVNIIYGANGCGKTTISKVLQSPDTFPSCNVVWANIPPMETCVYNKKFREDNFGKGKLPGVFTLGSASKEEIENLALKQKQLEDVVKEGKIRAEEIDKLNTKRAALDNKFVDDCWKFIKQKHEHQFKEAFVGYLNSKSKFSEKVRDEADSNIRPIKSIEDLLSKAKTLFGNIPESITPVIPLNTKSLDELEEHPIWDMKIIGKSDIDISFLIQQLNISDWVNQGRMYLDKGSTICPFCQKETIDETFKRKLDEYFDDSFSKNSDLLKTITIQYQNLVESILSQAVQISESDILRDKFPSHLADIDLNIANIRSTLAKNIRLIENKLSELSRVIKLVSIRTFTDELGQAIDKINTEIEKHNLLVCNFKTEKANLISDVWRYVISDAEPLLASFTENKKVLDDKIKQLESEKRDFAEKYRTLHEDIKEANRNITSIQASVDAINRTLEFYGFTNFSIQPADNHYYKIQREGGEAAYETLSEGEVTFITFLYFMQVIKGGTTPENTSTNRVVLIDDPVSSLDSTILHIVSCLIKKEIASICKGTNQIKQLFLLTHNVYFHKEVSQIKGKQNDRKHVHYWIIR